LLDLEGLFVIVAEVEKVAKNPIISRLSVAITVVIGFTGIAFSAGGPGSTAAPFLKLPTGARAIGMGESYVASGDDVQAIGWNPAGITKTKVRQLTFMHSEWIEGIRYESLAYAQPLTGFISLGGGVDFLITSPIDRTVFASGAEVAGMQQGPEVWGIDSGSGTFDVSNVVVTAAGAVDASAMHWIPIPNVQLGATARALVQKVDKQSDFGAVVDIGALYTPETVPDMRLAMVAQNIGPALGKGSASALPPISFRAGVAYWLFNRVMVVESDLYQPIDMPLRWSFGTEYWYRNAIAFRAGYKLQGKPDLNEYKTNGLEGFTLGAGFRFLPVQVDYSYATLGFLGQAHRVSLTVNL